MTDSSVDDLAEFVRDWKPTQLVVNDELRSDNVNQLAATLDLDCDIESGAPLPLLWQWMYFNEWPATAALGSDGHPATGEFLPPIPQRRRMFAGGRVFTTTPLIAGELAQRHSSITKVSPKAGRSGPLLFVTVLHEYHQRGTVAVREEQDIVYRSAGGVEAVHIRSSLPFGEDVPESAFRPLTNATLLFRFSALTANSHRIHYDEPYATAVEGYPALVVHGPLLAIYMAEIPRRNNPDRFVEKFEFRLQRPVFIGDPIQVQGNRIDERLMLAVLGSDGTIHASAQASLS